MKGQVASTSRIRGEHKATWGPWGGSWVWEGLVGSVGLTGSGGGGA